MAWHALGLMLAHGPRTFLTKEAGRDVFETAENLVDMFVDRFTQMQDKELRRESRRQRKAWRRKELNGEPDGRIRRNFGLIGSVLHADQQREFEAGIECLEAWKAGLNANEATGLPES